MPYPHIEDLPEPIRTHLPLHAQEIYRAAFNAALETYAGQTPLRREVTAHRVAWAAVKHRYRKADGDWMAR